MKTYHRLGDLATFINGYPFKPEQWGPEGKGIIRIQNLTGSTSTLNRYSGVLPEKYLVRGGDLLISWSATLGIYEWERDDSWLNQHIFKVVFDKVNVHRNYFKYLIKSKLDEIQSHVHGATMKHITKAKFDNIPVELPPLHIQEQIADTLDKADALRRKDQELLKKYDELAEAIFYNVFGDPKSREKKWETKTIGSLCEISSGSTPSREREEFYGGSIPWVKTGEVNGKRIYHTEETLTEEGLNESSCKIYPQGSIIIAMYGQGKTRGQVGYLECEAATNQACAVIRPTSEIVPDYLFYLLKYSYNELRDLGRGGNQPNLNAGMVKAFSIFYPPLDIQRLFSSRIRQVENQIRLVTQNILNSNNLFESLTTKYFT